MHGRVRAPQLSRSVRQTMRRVTLMFAVALILFQAVRADFVVILIHPGAARIVLLHPAVANYLHTDLPERQPFLLSSHLLLAKKADLDLPFDVELLKVGDRREGKAFQFTSSEGGPGNILKVSFVFPPEGLRGEAAVRHENGRWSVTDIKVVED